MSARTFPEVRLRPDEVEDILRCEDGVDAIMSEPNPAPKRLWEADDLKEQVYDIVCGAIDETLERGRE